MIYTTSWTTYFSTFVYSSIPACPITEFIFFNQLVVNHLLNINYMVQVNKYHNEPKPWSVTQVKESLTVL